MILYIGLNMGHKLDRVPAWLKKQRIGPEWMNRTCYYNLYHDLSGIFWIIIFHALFCTGLRIRIILDGNQYHIQTFDIYQTSLLWISNIWISIRNVKWKLGTDIRINSIFQIYPEARFPKVADGKVPATLNMFLLKTISQTKRKLPGKIKRPNQLS